MKCFFNLVLMLSLAIAISGCASSDEPEYAARDTPEKLRENENIKLAYEYGGWRGHSRGEQYKTDLIGRDVFTEEQWKRIDEYDLRVGDHIAFVYACWGRPASTSNNISSLVSYQYLGFIPLTPEQSKARGKVYLKNSIVQSIIR